MNVRFYIKATINVALVTILLFAFLPVAYASTTIATSTTSTATYIQSQRKTFYANSLYWVFYSDGTNLVYRTSTDGVTWSSPTTVRACALGNYFDVGFFPDYSSTYVYYVYAGAGDLLFRRGTISGSSITWGTEETIQAFYTWYHPSVAVCTDGRVVVTATFIYGANTYCYIFDTTDNDGSSGWTATLGDSVSGVEQWRSTALPLTSGKAYVLFSVADTIYGKLFNGSSWGSSETATQAGDKNFGATKEGDDVHLAYYATTAYTKAYRKRTYGAGTPWGDEETIRTMASVFIGITISVDTSTSDLYAFWGERQGSSPFYYQVLYSKKPSGGSWSSPSILASNEPNLKYTSINAFKRAWNDVVGVVWVRGELSPYDVRYAVLSFEAKEWHDVVSWDFNLTARQWLTASTWNFNFSGMQWQNIVDWQMNLTTMAWKTVTTWSFNVIGKAWNNIAQWSFSLVTLGWHTIAHWILTISTTNIPILFIAIIFVAALILVVFILSNKKD